MRASQRASKMAFGEFAAPVSDTRLSDINLVLCAFKVICLIYYSFCMWNCPLVLLLLSGLCYILHYDRFAVWSGQRCHRAHFTTYGLRCVKYANLWIFRPNAIYTLGRTANVPLRIPVAITKQAVFELNKNYRAKFQHYITSFASFAAECQSLHGLHP